MMYCLVHLSPCWDMVVYHEEMELFLAFFVVNGRNEHAAGVDTHHGSRRQIGNGDAGLADELFRFVEGMNAAQDDAVCACSVIEGKLKELL